MKILKITIISCALLAGLYAFTTTVIAHPAGEKTVLPVKKVTVKVSFQVQPDATAPAAFADTLKKAQALLSGVFSSKEFMDSLYNHSYNDSAFSKSKKQCYEVAYDSKTDRISGKTVYDNLLASENIELAISIKHNGDKEGTMGSSNACVYKITTYDYWLKEKPGLAIRLARHIAHEFTHVRGFRHDNKVEKKYKWGHKPDEDPAYGVGNIVGNILTNWSAKGLI